MKRWILAIFLILTLLLSGCEFSPNPTSNPTPIQPTATVEAPLFAVPWTPQWDLGSTDDDPTLGEGYAEGYYLITPLANGRKVEVWIFMYARRPYAGKGSGSYQIINLPKEIQPGPNAIDFAGHANIWIGGGGISEFDGTAKYTNRNNTPWHIIFTFDGQEWFPNSPKQITDFKLRVYLCWVEVDKSGGDYIL